MSSGSFGDLEAQAGRDDGGNLSAAELAPTTRTVVAAPSLDSVEVGQAGAAGLEDDGDNARSMSPGSLAAGDANSAAELGGGGSELGDHGRAPRVSGPTSTRVVVRPVPVAAISASSWRLCSLHARRISQGGDYGSRRGGALSRLLSLRSMVPLKRKEHDEDDDLAAGHPHPQQQPKRRLQLRKVIRSVAQSPNYRAWIGMEMLLEAQVFFQTAFLPTLMLRLRGVSYVQTEVVVAVIKPLRQLGSILTYIPMRRFGYARVYTFLFYSNLLLSILAFFFGNSSSKAHVYIVLYAFPIVSGAVLSSGFQFAMADLSLEVKYAHTTSRTGTSTEPSVAALLLGINTVFCKPVKYLFSVMAQNILHNGSGSPNDAFYLLIATPMICSCLQLLFWRRYGLTPERVSSMRDELQRALDDDSRSRSSDRLSAGV